MSIFKQGWWLGAVPPQAKKPAPHPRWGKISIFVGKNLLQLELSTVFLIYVVILSWKNLGSSQKKENVYDELWTVAIVWSFHVFHWKELRSLGSKMGGHEFLYLLGQEIIYSKAVDNACWNYRYWNNFNYLWQWYSFLHILSALFISNQTFSKTEDIQSCLF